MSKFVLWVGLLISVAGIALAAQDYRAEEMAKRIQPIGQVNVGGAAPAITTTAAPTSLQPVALGPDAGKNRYQANCAMCHVAGVAGAPKLGDKAAWKPRLAKGLPTLIKNAINGINAMPPKGTCATCSDEEIRLTVEYMVKAAK